MLKHILEVEFNYLAPLACYERFRAEYVETLTKYTFHPVATCILHENCKKSIVLAKRKINELFGTCFERQKIHIYVYCRVYLKLR